MRNIFIDFEASQYTQEIISIGAVTDTGEEFYSLVKTEHKVGNFVATLTGINQVDIENAPSPDEVFSNMFNWLQKSLKNDEKIQFICYGDSDLGFARNTLKNLKNSMTAQAMLSLIVCNIIDYAEYIKSYFGLSKRVSLIKVANYYDSSLVQNHCSLTDAKLLKFIYGKVQSGVPLVENPFEEYMQKIEVYDTNNTLIETFYGLASAAKWVVELNHMPKNSHKRRIKNKIIASSQQKQSYCGFNWVVYD